MAGEVLYCSIIIVSNRGIGVGRRRSVAVTLLNRYRRTDGRFYDRKQMRVVRYTYIYIFICVRYYITVDGGQTDDG